MSSHKINKVSLLLQDLETSSDALFTFIYRQRTYNSLLLASDLLTIIILYDLVDKEIFIEK